MNSKYDTDITNKILKNGSTGKDEKKTFVTVVGIIDFVIGLVFFYKGHFWLFLTSVAILAICSLIRNSCSRKENSGCLSLHAGCNLSSTGVSNGVSLSKENMLNMRPILSKKDVNSKITKIKS